MKTLILPFTLLLSAFTLTAQSKATEKPDLRFEKGEYRQASVDYQNLLKTGKNQRKYTSQSEFDMGYVYSRLGECYLYLREYVQAEYCFVKASEEGLNDSKFLVAYGDALFANNKIESALNVYQQCLAKDPENADALDRIRRIAFHVEAKNDSNVRFYPVASETGLNATNNQYALAWYKDALLFSSDRVPNDGEKIAPANFFYTRQDGQNNWMPPQDLKYLKTGSNSVHSFAYDANAQIYYVMLCKGGNTKDCNIYACYVDKDGKIGKPILQKFHNNGTCIGHPTLSSDGQVMFYTAMKGKSRSDIYMVRKIGEDEWTKPLKLNSTVNTPKEECYPRLFNDSILFFSSNGHLGMGGQDIFYTKIMFDGVAHAVSGDTDLSRLKFTAPVNLGAPINSSADDISILMRADGNGGFFISNRTVNEHNKSDIYSFSRMPFVLDDFGALSLTQLDLHANQNIKKQNNL
jgi:tetratricopeptide (TPR) repeat protein